MEKKSVILKLVLPIFTCFMSVAAVVIGAVAVAKAYQEPEIYGTNKIGLQAIFENEASEMFVDGPWPSDYITRSAIEDKELVNNVYNELRETLKTGVFVSSKKPKYGSEPGSGWHYSVIFTVNNVKYSFSTVKDDKLEVSIGGKTSYYLTNCWYQVDKIINNTVDYLSPEQDSEPT